jgi:hypothetical protein
MPAVDEHRCEPCQVTWTAAERPGLRIAGQVVVGVAALAAVAMLLLIQRGDTGPGGACAVAAMLGLGLGMWLQGKAAPRCPSCKGAPTAPAP